MEPKLSKPPNKTLLERKQNELNKLLEQNAELSAQIIDLQQQTVDLGTTRSSVVSKINQIILELNNGTQLRHGDGI